MTKLVAPFGGSLVDLCVPKAERPEIRAKAASLPSVALHDRAICDLELLATGAFSPRDRFLGRADHERVLAEMRLRDGTLWPISSVFRSGQTVL